MGDSELQSSFPAQKLHRYMANEAWQNNGHRATTLIVKIYQQESKLIQIP